MKNKFLTALFAVVLTPPLAGLAQTSWTDVTSVITNPSFETDNGASDLTSSSNRNVTGWTILPATTPANTQIGVAASNCTIQGIATSFPTTDEGKYLYFRTNWNSTTTFSASQTISGSVNSLPAGFYKLTCLAANNSGNWAQSNFTLSLQEGTNAASIKSYLFSKTAWSEWCVYLYKSMDGSDITISASMYPGSQGGSQHYQLLLDNFTLSYCSDDDLSATVESPMDLTAYISNPSIYSHSQTVQTRGWSFGSRTVGNGNYTEKTEDSQLEAWSGSSMKFDYYQVLNSLPNGKYILSAKCRDSNLAGGFLYATSNSTTVITAMAQDYSVISTDIITIVNNKLQIGIKANEGTAASWITGDDFSLSYLGPDLTAIQAAFSQNYTALQALTGNVPTAFATLIDNAKTTYATAPTTLGTLNAANAAMLAIINAHPSVVTAYAKITAHYDILTNSIADDGFEATVDGAKKTYKDAVDAVVAEANTKTNADDINAVSGGLETYRQAYVMVAEPINSTCFDFTFKVPDAVITSANAWTNSRRGSGEQYTGAPDNTYLDKWNATTDNDAYTELSGLPSGLYTIKAAGRASAGCTSAYIYVEGTTKEMAEIEKSGNTGNVLGNGWNWFTTSQTSSLGTLKIGFYSVTTSSQWAGADDFHLYFYGFDKTSAVAGLATLCTTAEALLLKDMSVSESVALEGKKEAASLITTTNTKNEIKAAASELQAAIDNANASITAYANLKAAIEKVTALKSGFATIATAQGVYNAYSGDVATINAATKDLYDAFEASATNDYKYDAPFDLTSYYLTNASFDEGTNGWTKTGSFTASHTWNVSESVLTFAPASGHYTGCTTWQEITLPAGAYKLSAKVSANELEGKTTYLFAATGNVTWDNIVNGKLASATVETYGEFVELSCVFALTEATAVKVGVTAEAYNNANNAFASHSIDWFKLEQAQNQVLVAKGNANVVGTVTSSILNGLNIEATTTSLDLTAVSIPESSSVAVTNSPNCLIYAKEGAANLSNAYNKVVESTCTSLVLTDKTLFNAPFSFNATAVQYAREYTKDVWSTVCLPFNYTLPDGVTAEQLSAVDLTSKTFVFTVVTELQANQPYIIKNSNETAALFNSLANVAVEATPKAMNVEILTTDNTAKAQFLGTYKDVNAADLKAQYDVLFFNTSGQLKYVTSTTEANITINPFRAYVLVPTGAISWTGGAAVMRHDGNGTTLIEEMEVAPAEEEVVYDLMGRRVNHTVKGNLYIVNGKKMFVK